ncbi:MAG: acyl-CoA thioesterase [Simkaniaceae bacterium]|nr:acyl-CoA thioesterase [Candidatus Sacchlamyda saccharinae]
MTQEPKPVNDSAIDDQTALVFPNDLNTYGTLFGGRVLELGDWLCCIVAKRHSGKVSVTLGLDSVRFLASATSGDILVLKAAVNRAWNSSMEVGLKVLAEDYKTKTRIHIFSAYFTFVALDENRKPTRIPAVIPETDEQKRRFAEAEVRRQKRFKDH